MEICRQEITCICHSKIELLLKSTSIHLGFDLNKYAHCPGALDYIAMLCSKHSSRIVLSSGLTLKTELTAFGGDGYKFHASNSDSSILTPFSRVVKGDILREVTMGNKLQLLDWNEKKEKVELVMTWEWDKCGRSESGKVQAFQKFGQKFCSMKCLKSFTF